MRMKINEWVGKSTTVSSKIFRVPSLRCLQNQTKNGSLTSSTKNNSENPHYRLFRNLSPEEHLLNLWREMPNSRTLKTKQEMINPKIEETKGCRRDLTMQGDQQAQENHLENSARKFLVRRVLVSPKMQKRLNNLASNNPLRKQVDYQMQRRLFSRAIGIKNH